VNFSERDLVRSAKAFRSVVQRAKERVERCDFEWYPFDQMSTVIHQVAPLLNDGTMNVLESERALPLLDLGCGDGAISFFFESLGFRVMAVDCAATNHNHMRGVHALKAALNSSVALQSANLDDRFQIEGGQFGIALLFGVLYHLKNPFYALEKLSELAHYCFLTTRIAQKTPGGADIGREPLAYLVEPCELNEDLTNYWIFSEPGLRRLVARAGWTICQFRSTGFRAGSDLSPDRDERACCLLRSRVTCGARIRLLSGWHRLEQGSFRWTEQNFSVIVRQPVHAGAKLHFRFVLVPELLDTPLTLTALAEGIALPPATYSEPGERAYYAELPDALRGKQELQIEFTASKILSSRSDTRELSLLVSFRGGCAAAIADNAPLEIGS
jgi:tRNA (mo5U34)-methyltransferase